MPGSDEVIRNLDAWFARVKAELLAAAEEEAQNMQFEAQAAAPWQDETGEARASIIGEAWEEPGWIKLRVGIQDRKGAWLELGTGPRGQQATGLSGYSPEKRIYPRRARYLRWVDKEGNIHYSRSVRWLGMKPRSVIFRVRDRRAPIFFARAKQILSGGPL